MTEPLPEMLARLDREKAEADRRYNEALTALDGTVPATPELPVGPQAYDESRLPALNEAWNILPSGAPAAGRSLKGRLRGFIWRLVGPSLEAQRTARKPGLHRAGRDRDSVRRRASFSVVFGGPVGTQRLRTAADEPRGERQERAGPSD